MSNETTIHKTPKKNVPDKSKPGKDYCEYAKEKTTRTILEKMYLYLY